MQLRVVWFRAARRRDGMLAAGTSAPRFTAQNHEGKELRLEDFVGKKSVVLYFFPKDNTPG
jgi:peroxiredoxin Q/BCP